MDRFRLRTEVSELPLGLPREQYKWMMKVFLECKYTDVELIRLNPPAPCAHLVTFWREKKVPPLQTQRHNSSNNYTKMERRKDGNFLIARQISDALRTKIAWGLIAPWQSGVPF